MHDKLKMFKGKSFSLVLPAYNEGLNIKKNIEAFIAINLFDEVIVVDNNSSDDTANEIKKTSCKYVEEKTQGYGAAIRKGMAVSTGDYIVLCEPDGTFSANDMDKFLAYLNDFDCVFGTRTSKPLIQKGAKMQFHLRYGNILVAKVLEYLYFGPSLTDVGCTYKVISRNSYEKIKNELKVIGSEFQPELMIRILLTNIKVIEIPVN